jgi:hypothetical protein
LPLARRAFAFDCDHRIRSSVAPGLVAGEENCAQHLSRDPDDPFTAGPTEAIVLYIHP